MASDLYDGCYAVDPFGLLCQIIKIEKDYIDYNEISSLKTRRIVRNNDNMNGSFFNKVIFVDYVGDDIYYPLNKIITNPNNMDRSVVCGVSVDVTGLVTYFVNGEWIEGKILRKDGWLIENHPFGYPVKDNKECLLTSYDD